MRAMIVVALALTGCSKWPAIESSKRLPTDPRLGFVLVETGPQVPTFVEASAANGRLMVGVFTGAGVDPDLQPTTPALRFWEVESKTGAATPLPSAPLTPTDDFDFGVTLTERTILFSSAKTGEAAYFDGTGWFALPTLPVDARSTRFMIARSATEIVVRGSNLYRLVGSAWQLVPVGARLVLGPWGNTGLRVITQPGTLCTSLLDVSTGTLTTPVCQFTNAGTIQFDAVNGTVDDFQLITSPGYVWHFQAGTWHAGEILPIDRPRATPAGADLIVDVTPKTQADAFQSPVATLMALRGGAKSRVLLPASSAAITCACDRSDDSACECVRRPLVNGLTVFGDGSAAVLFGVSDADARRQIFVRRFDLPGDTGFDRATCSTPCPTAKACHFVSLTDTACIWDLSQSSTGPLSDDPAVTLTTVTPRDGMAVTLSVTLLDGGAADVTMATPLPNLTLLGKAHVGYRLSLSGPDLVTKHVEVTMPDTQRTAELGAIPLVRGIRLGDVLWPLSSNQSHTVVSRGGGMAVPVTSGNGARWWWLQGLADGGVTTQDLLAAPSSPRRARIDPNGRFLLLPTDVGLALLEVQTLRVVDTLAGTDWDTNFVTFANAADVFAIRRGGPSSTASAEPAGITELIAFSATGFMRRFQVTTPGTVLEVAGLGGSVLRLEAGQTVLHTATTTTTLGSLTKPLVSGDGARVYELVGNVLMERSDGGTTTIGSPVTFFAVEPAASNVLYLERGQVKRRDATGATTLVIDGGISPVAFGVGRLGAFFTVAPSGTGPYTSITPAFPSIATSSAAFFERETGELFVEPACGGPCEAVIARGGMERRLKVGPGPVFGLANDRAKVGNAIAPVNPLTGMAQPAVPFVPSTGPTPTIDGRFTFGGDPRQDSFGAPCLLFSVPTTRFDISTAGVVTKVAGRDELDCVW